MGQQNPNQNFGCLLHDTARLLRRDFNRRAQVLGLTQTQWQALCVLSRNEGTNQASLAEMLEVQPITIGRLIDRLEATGWVERRNHPSDRRATTLYLTSKAEPILNQMSDLAEETRELALSGISQAEQDTMIAILERIKQNLLSHEDGADTDTPSS